MGENVLVFRRHRYFGVKYYDVYSLQMVQPNTHTHTCALNKYGKMLVTVKCSWWVPFSMFCV